MAWHGFSADWHFAGTGNWFTFENKILRWERLWLNQPVTTDKRATLAESCISTNIWAKPSVFQGPEIVPIVEIYSWVIEEWTDRNQGQRSWKRLLPNASMCAQHTVRPNKPRKAQKSLLQDWARKIGGSCSKDLLSDGLGVIVFLGKI